MRTRRKIWSVPIVVLCACADACRWSMVVTGVMQANPAAETRLWGCRLQIKMIVLA